MRNFLFLFCFAVTLASRKSPKLFDFLPFTYFVKLHLLPVIAGRRDILEPKSLEKMVNLVYQTHLGVAGERNYSSLDLLCKFTKEGL